METTLYKITFTDGRIFRVFCENGHQKERMHRLHDMIGLKNGVLEVVTNGIHNIKQWEEILKADNK